MTGEGAQIEKLFLACNLEGREFFFAVLKIEVADGLFKQFGPGRAFRSDAGAFIEMDLAPVADDRGQGVRIKII